MENYRREGNTVKPKAQLIQTAIHEGIEEALIHHQSLTGYRLSEGPEHQLTSCIGDKLRHCGSDYSVEFEYRVTEALKEADDSRVSNPPNDLRPRGRVDLMVWEGNKPIGIVEVKRQRSTDWLLFGRLKEDIERVESFLSNSSSIRFGAIGVYVDADKTWDNGQATRGWKKYRKNMIIRVLKFFQKEYERNFKKRNSDDVKWKVDMQVHGNHKVAWGSFAAVAQRRG